MYKKLRESSCHSFDEKRVDQLMADFESDVYRIRLFFSEGIFKLIHFLLLSAMYLVVMFMYSVPLFLSALIVLPAWGFVLYQSEKALIHKQRNEFDSLISKPNDDWTGLNAFLPRRSRLTYAEILWAGFFFVCGGLIAWTGILEIGKFIAVMVLWGMILYFLPVFCNELTQMHLAESSSGRLLKVLRSSNQASQALTPRLRRGYMQLEEVFFSYSQNSMHAVNAISFMMTPGRTIGIIGKSGSGKTTLAHLMTGFYTPERGRITFDGEELNQKPPAASIAAVFEYSSLTADTVKANIAFSKPEAPMSEIIEAAKLAHAHDFIMELPEQYNTVLLGSGFSNSQMQRLAIARSLCVNPGILILDDAASEVDIQTRQKIYRGIKGMKGSRAIIILDDSVEAVCQADEIFVLCKGIIAERGTHKELLEREGIYARLLNNEMEQEGTRPLKNRG
ncbi:ATP-binding cassette domain-containing protein [Bacillus sp. SJS]|uniref:ATP-binding cassette domain-containing protein n=1 Tax=Bacillus sp. SJS TaxID=1423321 RepID=UPI0004DD6E6C|nr:ABC transporter ATP-binding protein [Bacillus sp. SJS]KZZ85293.1 hypothetical protein AS29_006835 [Bacillus sp. SJS]